MAFFNHLSDQSSTKFEDYQTDYTERGISNHTGRNPGHKAKRFSSKAARYGN
jgi:hypothetical protein